MLSAWQCGRLGRHGVVTCLANANVARDRQVGMIWSTRRRTIRRCRGVVAPADRRASAPRLASRCSHWAATVLTSIGVFGERREGVEGGRLIWDFGTSGGDAALDRRRCRDTSLFEGRDGVVCARPRVPG